MMSNHEYITREILRLKIIHELYSIHNGIDFFLNHTFDHLY